ncbi:MAG: hypothetical protein ACE5H9_04245 [Anaerolineae bacterium]
MLQRLNPLLWILVLISLALNIVLLVALNQARRVLIDGLVQVEAGLANMSDDVIRYEFEIDQTIPINTDVPFNRTLEVPLKTNFPIHQVFEVPVNTPLGVVNLEIPLDTEIPVDLVVPITIDETINIETEVPLELSIPLEIDIAQTPLAGYLLEAQSSLRGFREGLENPLGGQ